MSPRQSTPLTIEHILLGLLYKEPKHGYELHKIIKQSPGLSTIWYVKPGKLYALLGRLEKDGLLISKHIPSQKTPTRKEYHITKIGESTFLEWVKLPVKNARDMRLVFHARVYFALELGEETAFNLIEEQRKVCRQWIEQNLSLMNGLKGRDFITEQIYNFRIGQTEAMLTWLDKCEKNITAIMKVQNK